MESYRQAVEVLPQPLRTYVLEVDEQVMARTEEVRLRLGYPPALVLPEGECVLSGLEPVGGPLLEQLLEIAGRYSVHTVLEQLRRGYLTVAGGHRLGNFFVPF